MVWISNYASDAIVVSITAHNGGDARSSTVHPNSKQKETWSQNHWQRWGPETITITWTGGKSKDFSIHSGDRVLVWDDAYGVESNVPTTHVP
ncbi:hypothetical protein MVEN_00139400 [Mycena venus]|uniref:Uncharacterized protein n=1 Tax=Mycena venus TaxID=2733690 RepID=A0A8H6YXD5_9AGAR|nr:hypothetical protein MVEN_00139400 [Mycena venus]